jgi:hypothetical protein
VKNDYLTENPTGKNQKSNRTLRTASLFALIALGALVLSCSKYHPHSIEMPNPGSVPDGAPDGAIDAPVPPANTAQEKFIMIQKKIGADVAFALKSNGKVLDENCVANKICNGIAKNITSITVALNRSTAPRLKVVSWGISNCAPLAGTCEIDLAMQKKVEGSLVIVPIEARQFALLQDVDPSMTFVELKSEKNSMSFSTGIPSATLAIPKIFWTENAFAKEPAEQKKRSENDRSHRSPRSVIPATLKMQFGAVACEYRGRLKSRRVNNPLYLQNCRDRVTGKVIALRAPRAGEIAPEIDPDRHEWWVLPKETKPESVALLMGSKVKFNFKVEIPMAVIAWERPEGTLTDATKSSKKK